MPHKVVADDTFLMTEKGPVLATLLEGDADRVWMVDRNGAFALSVVKNVKTLASTAGWRIFTEAGDVVLTPGALAMTSAGPLSGAEIEHLSKRQVIRLDIVSPRDLPSSNSSGVPLPEVYRSCLAALPSGIIQLPSGNGIADEVGPRILEVLAKADIRYRIIRNDRWMVLVLEPVKSSPSAARAEFAMQAEVLAITTAWAGRSDSYESRVRLGDCALRRRLLASATGAGRGFSVRWLPGYCPVESRVWMADEPYWPARVPVQGISKSSAVALHLETELAGDLVVSLAVLRAEPGE